MIWGSRIRPTRRPGCAARNLRGARDLGAAAVLGFGVTLWLHGLRAASLTGGDLWSGRYAHIIRDGALAIPIAFLALRIGAWLAERWRVAAPSHPALTAIALSLLLVVAAGPHKVLDRAIEGTTHAHVFHGQPRTPGVDRAGWITSVVLQGSEDALLCYIAALPLMLFCLAVLPEKDRNSRRRTDTAPVRARPPSARFILSTTMAWALIGVGAAALGLAAGPVVHRDRAAALAHEPLVTEVTVARVIDAGELRVTLESAKWVRQPQPVASNRRAGRSTDPIGGSDRLYLEVTIENPGSVLHTVGRAAFRMLAKDGAGWAPLADDFPAILLNPGEKLGTSLVFELPPAAAHLELAASAGSAEARIPITDDDLGGVFGTLCRALSKSWDG
jgi:hypothetical protein